MRVMEIQDEKRRPPQVKPDGGVNPPATDQNSGTSYAGKEQKDQENGDKQGWDAGEGYVDDEGKVDPEWINGYPPS